ncbi:dihydrofolate reductase family protein [Streptomyces albus]|uniref:dihydrofolate reductase family protein n=1 Tax=Streptomyces sp. PHES57 TaxID=2872626 RepID=UPI001CEDE874|nr:dihydrofolate reductase family protein [Streptomyces sp. PHES57]
MSSGPWGRSFQGLDHSFSSFVLIAGRRRDGPRIRSRRAARSRCSRSCSAPCSLDGCHEGPRGELDWGLHDEEFFDWNLRQTREVGALLLGRRTHEHFAEAWPSPETAERLPEATAFMNAVPRAVVTRSGRVTPWEGTRVTDGSDLAADMARLRAATEGDIAVFGISSLTVTLLEQGLMDELRTLLHPVVLGGGRSLFAGLKDRLDLAAGR